MTQMRSPRALYCYPSLLPGETLLSGLRRAAFQVGGSALALCDVLGIDQNRLQAHEGIPGYVAELSAALPKNHPQKQIARLIENHTIAPALSFFDLHGWQSIYGRDGEGPVRRLHSYANSRCERERFRHSPFCRHCVLSDIASVGCPITYREWVIPGSTHCPRCEGPLEWPCSLCRRARSSKGSLTLERPCRLPAHPIRYVHSYMGGTIDELRGLSRDLASICSRTTPLVGGVQGIWQAYGACGCNRGKFIDRRKTMEQLRSHLSEGVLSTFLFAEHDEAGIHLRKFPRPGNINGGMSVAQGLCLIHGLGRSLAKYEADFVKEHPLNVEGSFVWEPIWRAEALERFAILGNVREVAEVLQVSSIRLRRELRALGVAAPKKQTRRLDVAVREVLAGKSVNEIASRHKVSARAVLASLRHRHPERYRAIHSAHIESVRTIYRALVQDVLAENPTISRTELSRNLGAATEWLRRCDRDWLDRHVKGPISPPGRRGGRTVPFDVAEGRRAIREAAAALKAGKNVRRISPQRILAEAGFPPTTRAHQDVYLSLASSLSESTEDWVRRSLAIMAQDLVDDGQQLMRANFLRQPFNRIGFSGERLTEMIDEVIAEKLARRQKGTR